MSKSTQTTVIENRQARFNYELKETLVAGLVLEGWEIKSARAGKVSLAEGYIVIRQGEAFLQQVTITPLSTASSHVPCEPTRLRKLLLNKREIARLTGAVEQDGHTLVPLSLFWQNGRLKLSMALAKGKTLHDKRQSERERDWSREQGRLMKSH